MKNLKTWWQKYPTEAKWILAGLIFFSLYFATLLFLETRVDERTFLWLMQPGGIFFVFLSLYFSYGTLLHTEKFVDSALAYKHLWLFGFLTPKKLYKKENYKKFTITIGWVSLILGLTLLVNVVRIFIELWVY